MNLFTKTPTPYAEFDKEKMILRDQLALDRTILANERTMLAYARTALGLFLAGGTILKFFPGVPDMMLLGALCLALAVFTSAIGAIRYMRLRRELATLRKT